jgi:hypothetical protein
MSRQVRAVYQKSQSVNFVPTPVRTRKPGEAGPFFSKNRWQAESLPDRAESICQYAQNSCAIRANLMLIITHSGNSELEMLARLRMGGGRGVDNFCHKSYLSEI